MIARLLRLRNMYPPVRRVNQSRRRQTRRMEEVHVEDKARTEEETHSLMERRQDMEEEQ
jgi:hypothetical protein